MNTTNNSAPLALRFNAPAAFGSNEEINAIVERMAVLMPTRLADWQLKPNFKAEAEKSLDEAFYKTAQLAIFYRLVPGQDIHIIPFGNRFVVDMGIESWKKSADRYCSLHHITYHVHTEEMSLDELKQRRGNKYDAEDVGVVAYLWRSDKEKIYQIFGPKESMSRACGVWAKKAKEVNGRMQEDTIPAQRTKEDVAKRRAIKAVLKLEFSLDSLLAATPAEIRQNIHYLETDIRNEQMRQAVPDTRTVEIDEDGFIIVEPSNPRPAMREVEFVVVEETEMEDAPDVDDMQEATEEAHEERIDYRALAANLTGDEKTLVDWAKKYRDASGPASLEQYRFLSGEIDKLTAKGGHNLVLGVLVGRHVNSTNVPTARLCKLLLDFLLMEVPVKDGRGLPVRNEEGEIVKEDNPYYRQSIVDSIKVIWRTISEAV